MIDINKKIIKKMKKSILLMNILINKQSSLKLIINKYNTHQNINLSIMSIVCI